MLFALRKLRKSLIGSSSLRRYTLYALGEIALVVVGILIALQINNWSEEKKSDQRELSLLSELRSNLETNVINLQRDVSRQVFGANCLGKVISHLEARLPYSDSMSYFLTEGMPAPDVILTSSAFETLKSAGLESIRSDSLRRDIINLFEVVYPELMQETKRLEDQIWPAVVVPLQQKHFKVMPDAKYIPTDYSQLLTDQEFINMLSFRLALRTGSTELKTKTISSTKHVIFSIERELEIRKNNH